MTVLEIARMLGGKLQGGSSRDIRSVASLEDSAPGDLTFAEGARAVARVAQSRAGCVLVAEGVSIPGHTTVAVAHPKAAFIRAPDALRPPAKFEPGIHPTAVVAQDAELTPDLGERAPSVAER